MLAFFSNQQLSDFLFTLLRPQKPSRNISIFSLCACIHQYFFSFICLFVSLIKWKKFKLTFFIQTTENLSLSVTKFSLSQLRVFGIEWSWDCSNFWKGPNLQFVFNFIIICTKIVSTEDSCDPGRGKIGKICKIRVKSFYFRKFLT